MSKRHTPAEMRARIADWQSSSLDLRSWADQEGVKYATAQRWKQKSSQAEVASQSADLVPVRVRSASRTSPPLEIMLENGLCVRVAPGAEEQELVRVVLALREC
jgi:hypothetical protein